MFQRYITILILFIQTSIFGQIDFSGYVIDLPIHQSMPKTQAHLFGIDENSYINLTRLRLKPTAYLWSGARINIEYEIGMVYFSSDTPFEFTSGEKSIRQAVDLSWSPVNENKFLVNHYIDRFYLRQGFDFGNVVIGRQRISWGTGRIWNPTDLFNPINPANFAKIEKDGADAVSFTWNAGYFTDLNVVFNAKEKLDQSNYGVRFRTNYGEYDMAAVAGKFDNRYVLGLDFAGNFFGAGVRGEGIYSFDKKNSDDNFIKYILGIDYQFTAELYALLEYHFNGEGKTNKFEYEFQRLLKGEILNLNRNYLYSGLTYQYNPLLTFAASNISNLNDRSGYFGITGSYSVTENFYTSLGVQLTYGNDYTEYWYYPNSIYLQGEFYF